MDQSPLYTLLNEINTAAMGGLPSLALTMTVALPDICASLASPDGRTTSARYKKWCLDNLSTENFSFVTPDDLYSMRCGVLHNGRFGDMQHNVARVIFLLPGSPSFVNCKAGDAYCYSVVDFCRNFTDAVHAWMRTNMSDPIVQANITRLMQYRPDGVPPYIVGTRVLA